MKALTGTCSKAIGSPSHRVGVVHVPDRVEFCFSLRSRNDKRSCNCWLLKLVQNKGIYPVHAVPSKTEVCFFLCLVYFLSLFEWWALVLAFWGCLFIYLFYYLCTALLWLGKWQKRREKMLNFCCFFLDCFQVGKILTGFMDSHDFLLYFLCFLFSVILWTIA